MGNFISNLKEAQSWEPPEIGMLAEEKHHESEAMKLYNRENRTEITIVAKYFAP